MTNFSQQVRLDFILRTWANQMWQHARSDGAYDFKTRTPLTEEYRYKMKFVYRGFVYGQVSEKTIKEWMEGYCELIKKETIREFRIKLEARRIELLEIAVQQGKEKFIPPIDTVQWDWKELLFINEIFNKWFPTDNYIFNNDFPEQDYSHIPIGKHISSLDQVLDWGKRHRGKTIREIMQTDLGYMRWMVKDCDVFAFTDEMRLIIQKKCEEKRIWD